MLATPCKRARRIASMSCSGVRSTNESKPRALAQRLRKRTALGRAQLARGLGARDQIDDFVLLEIHDALPGQLVEHSALTAHLIEQPRHRDDVMCRGDDRVEQSVGAEAKAL